jgi:hypothetical protein
MFQLSVYHCATMYGRPRKKVPLCMEYCCSLFVVHHVGILRICLFESAVHGILSVPLLAYSNTILIYSSGKIVIWDNIAVCLLDNDHFFDNNGYR